MDQGNRSTRDSNRGLKIESSHRDAEKARGLTARPDRVAQLYAAVNPSPNHPKSPKNPSDDKWSVPMSFPQILSVPSSKILPPVAHKNLTPICAHP
jgi:hypothetical protein